MTALCTNHEHCGGVNLGYGWEYLHRLNLAALKRLVTFSRFATCPKCSGRSERIAA